MHHIRSKKLIEDSTKHLKDIEDTLKVSLRKKLQYIVQSNNNVYNKNFLCPAMKTVNT